MHMVDLKIVFECIYPSSIRSISPSSLGTQMFISCVKPLKEPTLNECCGVGNDVWVFGLLTPYSRFSFPEPHSLAKCGSCPAPLLQDPHCTIF